MANITTPTASNHFQQLRNRQNDLYRKNTQELITASKANDRPLVDKLRAERANLSKNDTEILNAELSFQATQLSQSDAEKRLVAETKRANSLVKGINDVAKVLASAGEMASILARLIALLA
jgi:hypothetical protein